MNPSQPPLSWRESRTSVLDVLLWFRENGVIGLNMYVGAVDVRLFQAFVDGLAFCRWSLVGDDDDAFGAFIRYTVDRGIRQSAGGWWDPLLAKHHGDHLAAIGEYLDIAATFAAERSKQRQS